MRGVLGGTGSWAALPGPYPAPSVWSLLPQCPTCAKCFLSRTELQLHEAFKHRGEKLFVCEECGHRASSRNGLQMHTKAKHRLGLACLGPAGSADTRVRAPAPSVWYLKWQQRPEQVCQAAGGEGSPG